MIRAAFRDGEVETKSARVRADLHLCRASISEGNA
jgi:hypothetical protein